MRIATYRFSLKIVENWKFKIKLEQLQVFTKNITFESLISFIMGIKFYEIAFFSEGTINYFI